MCNCLRDNCPCLMSSECKCHKRDCCKNYSDGKCL
jgi:hypothetical protein